MIPRLGVVGRAVAWTIAGIGCWLGYHVFFRNARLLLRIEALRERLATPKGGPESDQLAPSGLPVGSACFDFALPTLSGDVMALSDCWGRRVLLIFFDPECSLCRQMLPDLARLKPDPRGVHPVSIIISTDDAESNRQLMGSFGVRCPVLLQERNEVAQLCLVNGTPMGYLLDEQGFIASPLAVGAEAILALAGARPLNGTGAGEEVRRTGNAYTPTRLSLVASRQAKSNGLAAGKEAPGFRLPRVDGSNLALDELRGQQVLLVFSDPACPFCDDLAPKLQQVNRETPDIRVLIISRRGIEANRAAIIEGELTIPVVLQRHWEISREYGILGAPIAFLIDEAGIIAAPVAIGMDEILALAPAPKVPTNVDREGAAK